MTYLLRSEYFKTALDTKVGGGKKMAIEVKECPYHVLSLVIDFIYGTEIPASISQDVAQSLLGMADLYLMEDLKESVSSIISKQLNMSNVLEMFLMGERHNALKLKETCANFLNTREALFNIVDKVLGGNLEEKFKRRTDFVSLGDYDSYMMATLKPNMVVQLNRATQLAVPIGAIGRFVSFRNRARKLVLVKWPSGLEYVHVCHLNILTPPINMEIFTDE